MRVDSHYKARRNTTRRDKPRHDKIFLRVVDMLELTLGGQGQLTAKTVSFGLREKNTHILPVCACCCMLLPDSVNSCLVSDTT
jgi:hypothetical protein